MKPSKRSRFRRPRFETLQSRQLLAVDFEFSYQGAIGSGIGFEDQTQGLIRRELLQSAANQLGQWFDHTATIQLRVLSEENINSETIASAKTEFADATGGGFGLTEVVRRKVIDGVDLNGSSLDGEIVVNWAVNWFTGPDPTDAAPNQEDFFGTMFHEILHTFGFGTDITLAGEDGYGTPVGQAGVWTQYDRFLSDFFGSPIINPNSFAVDLNRWNLVKLGGGSPDRGLFFNGPNARAANNGQPVGLFSPKKFLEGSSWSHVDDENSQFDAALMRSAGLTNVTAPRTLTEVEKGIFRDLGYSFTTPRPLMIAVADASISESQRTVVTVSRSPSTAHEDFGTEATLVNLSITNGSRVSLPTTVTILASQSSVQFVLQANENLIADTESNVLITASA